MVDFDRGCCAEVSGSRQGPARSTGGDARPVRDAAARVETHCMHPAPKVAMTGRPRRRRGWGSVGVEGAGPSERGDFGDDLRGGRSRKLVSRRDPAYGEEAQHAHRPADRSARCRGCGVAAGLCAELGGSMWRPQLPGGGRYAELTRGMGSGQLSPSQRAGSALELSRIQRAWAPC